ncbi:MAG: hypothetical protein JWM36_1175 [Hyphomicrobiales bacterium]|nr:hypothetical protein [Hyphomicrobiales bacterium]
MRGLRFRREADVDIAARQRGDLVGMGETHRLDIVKAKTIPTRYALSVAVALDLGEGMDTLSPRIIRRFGMATGVNQRLANDQML